MVTASGEVVRNGRQVALGTHVNDQVHPDDDVEQEVTVEQPVPWIVGSKSENDVTVVGHRDRVFQRW
jgi:hypothetical protein